MRDEDELEGPTEGNNNGSYQLNSQLRMEDRMKEKKKRREERRCSLINIIQTKSRSLFVCLHSWVDDS